MQAREQAISRRALLGAGSAALALSGRAQAGSTQTPAKLKVAIFSKHLRWVQGEELAQTASEIGFDGIDLAVRKGGHVEPEQVKTALPKLAAVIRQHGLEVPMLTTDIVDADTANAEAILSTMSELGIRNYRWGGFKYADDVALPKQLEAMRPRVERLAELNKRYRVGAMYHTHSGRNLVGAPVWDIYGLVKGLDPEAVAINYDVGHATIEGGVGGWIDSFRVLGPYLHGIAVKDFLWEKSGSGKWTPEWKPLGEGMVHLREFFGMVAARNFNGPLQLHFEYPLGGADQGKANLSISKEQVIDAMKRDLTQLRSYLREAKLA